MSPKIVDKVERQTELLSAAMSVFGEKGYHHATMQDVADKAGVSKGSLYDYFSSKEELLLCTAEWLLQTIVAAGLPTLREPGKLLPDRVASFMETMLRGTEQVHPVMFTVLQVWAEMGPDAHSPLRALCAHLYSDFADQLQGIFEDAITAGDATPFPTRPAALAILSVIDGALLQSMIAPEEFAAQRASRFIPQWCAAAVSGPSGGIG